MFIYTVIVTGEIRLGMGTGGRASKGAGGTGGGRKRGGCIDRKLAWGKYVEI